MTEPRNINFESVCSSGYNGLNRKGPHLPRSQLIEKLLRSIEKNLLFTIVSAPSATGKTSAVCIFSWMSNTHKTVYVPLLPDTSAFESLKRVGIDLLEDKWMACNDNDYTVVILDDAQLRYIEGNFWKTLIKDLPVTFHKRIRFIIICTYLLSHVYSISPAEFVSLSRIENEDLILTRDESFGLLTSNEIGLPSVLHSYSNLFEHMVRECAGHIGALRISVDYLAAQLKIVSTPFEQTVLDWFFSKTLLLRMERCFDGLICVISSRCISYIVDELSRILPLLTPFLPLPLLLLLFLLHP